MKERLLFLNILILLLANLAHAEKQEESIFVRIKESTVTNITCSDTNECLTKYTNGDWCKRGVVCVKSYCHIIHSFPCEYHQRCNSVTHQCDTMTCQRDSDCDDGKYCNGIERCALQSHTCHPPLNPVQCISGECNETLKKCIFTPILVSQWQTYKKSGEITIGRDNHASLLKVTKVKPRIVGHNTQVSHNDVFQIQDTTTNSSTVTLNSTEITIIICMVVFFIGVILMLLFFAVFTRAGFHETIYVDTQ
jgi:hypothetical protein